MAVVLEREPRIEHGDNTTVVARTDQSARPLREHERGGLLHRPLRQGRCEVAMVVLIPVDRHTDATNHLVNFANTPLALEGHRRIDRYAVDPCFRRRDRLPGRPLLERALERVLRAILRCRSISEHDDQRSKNLSV